MKLLSAVIVTYNSRNKIYQCLSSLFLQKKEDLEVVVVDNHSYDATVEIIQKNWPQVKIVRNNTNRGLPCALNQALREVRSRYVLIMNDDSFLGEEFLDTFLKIEKLLPSYVGGIAPLILNDDGRRIYSRGIHLSFLRRFYNIGEGEDFSRAGHIFYVFGCCLACCILRYEMLQDIRVSREYFDEDFFLVGEDVDFSWRAQKKGWRFVHIPQLQCFHQGGFSKKQTDLLQYLSLRNRYYLLLKNEDNFSRFALYFWLYDVPRFIYFAFRNRYLLWFFQDIKRNTSKMVYKRRLPNSIPTPEDHGFHPWVNG